MVFRLWENFQGSSAKTSAGAAIWSAQYFLNIFLSNRQDRMMQILILCVARVINILIDHPEEPSANLWQHTAMQLSRGCCKAMPCDNFEAYRQNRMGIFHGLWGDFFLPKAS